jgi:hypothetical protein
MITRQNPSCCTCSLATAETKDWTTKFIAKTEWIGFFDEAAGVGTDGLDFAGFLVFAVFPCGDAVKVVANVLWEVEGYGVHSIHSVDEFFKETIIASGRWIADRTTRSTVPTESTHLGDKRGN